jgi:hypothetical protein
MSEVLGPERAVAGVHQSDEQDQRLSVRRVRLCVGGAASAGCPSPHPSAPRPPTHRRLNRVCLEAGKRQPTPSGKPNALAHAACLRQLPRGRDRNFRGERGAHWSARCDLLSVRQSGLSRFARLIVMLPWVDARPHGWTRARADGHEHQNVGRAVSRGGMCQPNLLPTVPSESEDGA